MILTLFIGSFFLLLLIGVPVAFAMLLPSFLYLYQTGVPISVVAQRLFDPLTSPSFLAIPFYILAAEILNATGITEKLFIFARKVIGFIPGGLGQANILASMIFAGMSGSAIADAGGLGRIEMKAMEEAGYDMKYSAGITASSSVIGPIIPPSIPLVVYGIMAEQSVAKMFVGGLLPGIIIGLCLMAITFYLALRKPQLFPRDPVPKLKEIVVSTKEAFWALLIPVLIVGGILTGVFTPTEAGSTAVLYAVVLSVFSEGITLKAMVEAFKRAMRATAMVMFILGAALVFSWVVTISQMPQKMITGILAVTSNKYLILTAVGVMLLVMGMFLAGNASLIILAPILVSIAPMLEIDLIHLGVFLVLGCMTAVITPPVGGALFVIVDMTGLTVGEVSRGVVPFLIAIIVGMFIIMFFPQTVLFLPNLLWK